MSGKTKQTNTSSSSNESSTTTPGTTAGQAALPTYQSDWQDARGAVQGATQPKAAKEWTGWTQHGDTVAQQANPFVASGMKWLQGTVDQGYDTSSPVLQQQIASQQALSNNAFTQNAAMFKDQAAFGGAYGGTGYNDLAARSLGQQQLGDDARTSAIIAEWLNRQQQDLHAAPGLAGQYQQIGALAPGFQQAGYEAGERNRFNAETDSYNEATQPAMKMLELDNYYNSLLQGIPGQTTKGTGTQTQTQTSTPSTLSSVLGALSTVASVAAAPATGGLSLGGLMAPKSLLAPGGFAQAPQVQQVAPQTAGMYQPINPFTVGSPYSVGY